MKRIYHPYTVWEETKAGLWRREPFGGNEEVAKEAARKIMSRPNIWGIFMEEVVKTWKFSCEQNLSHVPSKWFPFGRVAWLGQAAICLATGQPEWITRQVWFSLDKEIRDAADDKAANAIKGWEKCQGKQ